LHFAIGVAYSEKLSDAGGSVKRALAGVVLLMFASFPVSAIRADTVHIASSTFPIGIAPITQQFLSKRLNRSFDWIGTAEENTRHTGRRFARIDAARQFPSI
jgi:hypothetical protein